MKRLFICCLFVFTGLFLTAQEPVRTEARDIWLTIRYTYKQNDTIVAFLSGADNIGLQKGQLLKAYQSAVDEVPGVSPKKEFGEVGAGYIYQLDDQYSAFIRLYNPADTLVEGDMIQIKLQVPVLPYRGTFSELAFAGMIFTDADRKPLYSLDYLVQHDSRQLEDSIFAVIVESLHQTYELVKNRTNLPPSILTKVTEGRFKKRIPLEIIRDAKRKDLESFFLYTKAYPVGYMGKYYRASESFAGWLISNSPYSVGEVRNGLFPYYKNKVEFNKRLPEYRRDVLSEHTASALASDALGLSDNLKYAEAHNLADFAIALGEGVKDTLALPTVYLCKAQVYLDQEKYTETISWCDKAIRAALLARNRDIEMQATIKKGFCFNKISRYNEAETVLREAGVKLNQYKDELGEADYNKNQRRIVEYLSSIRFNSGSYDEALQLLNSAIEVNNRINSYDAQVSNAGHYSFIGKVYNDQGKPGEAIPALLKAESIYLNNSDRHNSAIVENDLAYSYYRQGNYRLSIEKAGKAKKQLQEEGDLNNAGYSMSLIGSAYWQLGQYDAALAAHKESLLLREKSGNLNGQAYSWSRLGDLFKQSGSKISSLQAYKRAEDIYNKIQDSTGLAEVYALEGQVFLDDENYKNAARLFEMANGISHKSTVEALFKLGVSWSSIDTVKAKKYLLDARQKSREDGNTSYQFATVRTLARMAYNNRDKDTGDSYFEECAGLSRQMNTAYSQAQILSLKAYRFESETELDSALVYYRKAMVINDTVDKSGSVDNLNSIANIYISMGEFGQADDVLSKAILLARDISDSLALGSTLQFSSFLYSRTAEFRKGLSNNDSAIAIFNKSGHIIRLANTYASRGTLLSSMGENKLSIQAQLYADSLYKEEMQEEQRGILFNNIGTVYTSQGDYNTALKYLQKSLAVLPKGVISESYLLTQGNVAECYLGLKRNNEAKALLLQYLPMAQKMKLNRIASGMALVLGKTYLEENDPVKAAAYYSYAKQYAAASGEKEKSVDALVNLGRIYGKENKTDQAAASLREAGSLALQYKLNGGWEAYYELGILTYQVQQYDSAVVFFKQAVGLLEDQAEKLYGGDAARKIFNNDPRKADLYNKITFSYYKMGNINQAWAYANRSNIAGIRELSGSLSVNSTDEEKNEVLRQLFSMQQAKKALEQNMLTQQGQARLETLKKIEILEKDYTNFLQDVVKRFPELKDYFQGADADEFNKYKTKLPADMAVALFVLNDKNLMIFTLTREKLSVDTMTVDIAGRISAFIELIKNTGKPTGTGPLSTRSDPMDEDKTSVTGNFRDISDELYSVLISQVYNKIGGKRKWCIIPSGVFSNLPFQCLGKKTEDGAFHFLAEEHTIFYTNKISIFGEPAPPQGGPAGSFAAFGVPDAVLKYNISEVKNIGKIIGSDSTVYTDARATERMAKQSLLNKKYIHFATHGVLNYTTDYTESYLKLLPDKDSTDGNNGKLTMREIQSLGITDCDMVILSACQTAVSIQLVRGWNISPANSFLVSNVKTVVASLWKVADEPTGLLMEYFYENMKTMEKSEALRQAQIRLSQDPRFVHPNYWGAFVLYGDWR